MSGTNLSLFARIRLAWICFFRVLVDARFAFRVAALRARSAAPEQDAGRAPVQRSATTDSAPSSSPATGALQLLSLLQREGRFVDFVQQDIASFDDSEVGAAARVVHEGCRRALSTHARVVNVRDETEGAAVTLDRASADVKLVGNVGGAAPFSGVLRHRGWRVEQLTLPTRVGVHDPQLVAPAELELP